MVWIWSRIFRAPKTKQIKLGHPNNGHVLNKRRRKHIKEGPYTKVNATLLPSSILPFRGSPGGVVGEPITYLAQARSFIGGSARQEHESDAVCV